MPRRPSSTPLGILAFGAHPDDVEFGCGGILVREARAGTPVHVVICSRGEAGSHGKPVQRVKEAARAAKLLGATVEFLQLDGDAHLEIKAAHAIRLARLLRQRQPAVVLAPSLEQNQHPDHWRLGTLVRDATRLARYRGLRELKKLPVHRIGRLYFYAVAPEAEPPGAPPVLVDISAPLVMRAWTAAMAAHASQLQTRDYVEHQLARARVHGLRAGCAYAQPLYPNDPLVLDRLA